jgi:hypothetical protein
MIHTLREGYFQQAPRAFTLRKRWPCVDLLRRSDRRNHRPKTRLCNLDSCYGVPSPTWTGFVRPFLPQSRHDLVSYDRKRNWANGNDNQDGTDNNYSWNCGYEGEDDVPSEVLTLRRNQVKNFCTLLMLSNGIPMFRAGDEFLKHAVRQ